MANNNQFAGLDAAVDDTLKGQSQTQAAQIRNNVYSSVSVNPDKDAQYQHLARFVGVPVDTVRAQPDVVRQQAAMQGMDADKIVQDFPHLAQFMTDPNNTNIIHDAVSNTANVETAVKALPQPATPAPKVDTRNWWDKTVDAVEDVGGEAKAGFMNSMNKAAGALNLTLGAFPTVYDKVASVVTGKTHTEAFDWWAKTFVDPAIQAQQATALPPDAPFAAKAAHTAGSLVGTLAQIVATGGAAIPEKLAIDATGSQIVTQALQHGARSMAFPATTDAVDTGRRVYMETGDPVAAARAAQMQYFTTTLGGVVPLSAPGGIIARLTGGAVSGAATGEASRRLMNTALPANMQQPFSGEDLILSSLSGSVLAGALGPRAQTPVEAAVRDTYTDSVRAQRAQEGMNALQTLSKVATESALRERSPEAFKEFVHNMTDEGGVNEVYVSAKALTEALQQSGINFDELSRKMPDVARQVTEGLETNGDIRIPVADYATHIAGSPIDETLLPHLKTDPDGMTYQQSQEFVQKTAQDLGQQAQKLADQQQQISAKQAESDVIYQNILDQLNEANRFPSEVNKQYAELTRRFYETQADRTGISISDLYNTLGREPLKVISEGNGALSMPGVQEQPGGKLPPRGYYDPVENTIGLLKRANLSTFVHESGHFYLEAFDQLSRANEAPKGIKDDFDTIMKWFGTDADTWRGMTLEQKREAHERFARGFEQYVMEGKAPSIEMQSIFSRFRTWLLNIYRHAVALNVEISPEIRGVFDRMLASEDAIRETERIRGMEPLFKSAEEAGMSPEEYAKYQELGTSATQQAVDDLQRRSMRDMQWLTNARKKAVTALEKEALAKRKIIREEVEKEVAKEPIEQARTFIKKGEIVADDGSVSKTEGSTRINSGDLQSMYPEGSLNRPDIEKLSGMTSKTGLHPDAIAEIFGLPSGDSLVRELVDGPKFDEKVEGLTDQRMIERHAELADPQAVQAAADAAVHSEARARFVATELKALAKAVGSVRDLTKGAKEAAESAIAAKRVRDLRPAQYTAQEARAAKNAMAALAKGDITAAANEKRAQLLNNRLARAAADAVGEVQKGLAYLAKFDKPGVRENINVDYRDQIDSLLERFDLRKSSTLTELDKRQALADWVNKQREAGYEPAIPDKLLDEANRTSYKNMPVEDFRGLIDSVKSIEHLGKLKQRLLDGKEMREFSALVDEAVEKGAELPQKEFQTNRGLTKLDEKWLQAKTLAASADSSLLKMEQVIDWLDNHNPNGVFNRIVFKRIADASVVENDLRKAMSGALRELHENMPKDSKQDLDRKVVAPELIDSKTGRPSTLLKREVMAMALNMGNESNMSKLLAGEKWSYEGVKAVLDREMTKHDWDFVQGVWDAVNSLWPQIEAMERRLGNTAPEKIEAREVETPHGNYKGGYYPVVYDPLRSFDVEQNRQRSGDQLFENNYIRATTPKGHTIERSENYARPLLLSIDVIPRHLDQVIHDLAYREAIIDADRFLADSRIRGVVEGTLGREYYKQFRPWLQSIANDRTYDSRGLAFWDKAAHWARTNATIVGLGYRATTMLIHGGTAASNSVGEIGARWFANGLRNTLGTPGKMRDAYEFMTERSGEMRNRMNETDRDIREALREMDTADKSGAVGAAKNAVNNVRRFAYYGISMLDMASVVPTWHGAYNKALHEGMSESEAIYAADKAVRNAHGGGGVKDMAAVQRGTEVQKLFTMFYTFWNHFYNRQRDIGRMVSQLPGELASGNFAGARRDFAMVLARSWFYFVIPTILHAALKPPPPNSDSHDENMALWFAEEMGAGLFAGIPVVRDVVNSALTGRDFTATPAAAIVTGVGKSAKDVKNAIEGEPVSDKWLKHAIETSGYVFGLPTGQIGATTQFLWDVGDGKQDPQELADWYRGVVHGDMNRH